jgi:hypothetical protein
MRATGAAHRQRGRRANCNGGDRKEENGVQTRVALMPAARRQGTPPRPANRSMAPGDRVTARRALRVAV